MRSISFAMAHSERKHYLYLSSSDSELYYPNNTATDFTVELTETLNLPGEWECSLLEIFFTKRIAGDIVVFSDLCANSNISNTKLPVLRFLQNGTYKSNSSFLNLISLPITQREIQRIKIYIRTVSGDLPTFIDKPVRCTLLLKRIL